MPVAKTPQRTKTVPANLNAEPPLLGSFRRHLRAARKSDATVAHYCGAALQFVAFCRENGLPEIEEVRREHVEMWLEALHERYAPHSVKNRYVGLRIFFRWLRAENEIPRDPTERIPMPSTEETRKDIATKPEITRVLEYMEGAKRWRDAAIVAILYDTGMRVSELAELLTEHVDMDSGRVQLIHTKARRQRVVRLSPETLKYVDRYLRRRPRTRTEPQLLVGRRGPMTRSGLYQVVREAFEAIGVTRTISPHDLRHTSASHLAGAMSETDLMTLFGWRDPDMARHYSRQVQEENALAAHEQASPMRRLGKG